MKSICPILTLLLISAVTGINAQHKSASFITRLPFRQFSGGVIVVKACLNGVSDSLNFILDTGSGGISLDSSTCAKFGIATKPTDTMLVGIGGSYRVNYVFDRSLSLPGLTVSDLDFHVNDYDILSRVYGEHIDGIIGFSFLRRYIVQVDFDKQQVEVWSPGDIRYPARGTVLRPRINRIPTNDFRIRDAKDLIYSFYIDTGAGLCFLLTDTFLKDKQLMKDGRKFFDVQAEGIGGKLRMRTTVIKMLQVGRYRFRNVPVFVFNDEYNVTAYPKVGGLLGNDLLRRFNLILNYPRSEICLVPNERFRDPFDYSYTGISIYYQEPIIIIEDVMPGSPGEKAGLLPGDVLIGLGTNFSNNISQYRTLLQTISGRTKMVVRRQDELMELWITPVNIL